MFEIELDYAAAILVSKGIIRCGNECNEILNQMTDCINSSDSYWKGASGDAIREKLSECRDIQKKISQELESIGELIRNTAQKIKSADEEAARLAEGN